LTGYGQKGTLTMGMNDESWCDSCGTSQPYSEDDVTCGSCVADELESFIGKFDKYLSDLLKDKQSFVVQDIRAKFNEMARNVN
jgi:hypothetical protein